MFHRITSLQLAAVCLAGITASASCSLFFSLDGGAPQPTAEPPPPETEQPEEQEETAPCNPVTAKTIALIQFEETISTEKATLIDQFTELEDEALQNCLQTTTDKELIGLTFFDLSRHTNPVLAQKAKDLRERFNPSVYVEEALASEDEERREKAVEFLFRIEPDRAEKILEEVSFETEEEEGGLKEEVSNGVHRVLIPTDSSNGDRYFVRTGWEPENEEQVECLTGLFNRELAAGRSLAAEKEKMKELNGHRWAYWYSKDWALSLSAAVEKCGGAATFVPGPSSDPQPISGAVSPEANEEGAVSLNSEEDASGAESAAVPAPSQSGSTAHAGSAVRRRITSKASPKTTGKASGAGGVSSAATTGKAPQPSSSEQGDSPLQLYDSNKNGKISCTEAREHGIIPVTREHPAYKFMNDRNKDGVVCERQPRAKTRGR